LSRSLGDVLEALRVGAVVIGRSGAVEELNSVACRLLEHSREAVLGSPVEALIEPEHALARIARKALASGVAISELEQEIERRGGERAVVDVTASPLFAESDAAPDGVLILLRDRSADRRLELLEAERKRFESFGRIAAGLAHEIKNPLGGIRGAGELLAARAGDAKTREIADLVVRESARITRLVDELGVFARGDVLRLARANVHQVLDGVLTLVAHDPLASSCQVVRAYDPSIPELLADADRLTQVFLNLARNALQAMSPAGGVLTVTTRMTLDHRIALEEGRRLPTLAVWFEDSGRGMDPEELRQATTPFFTTRSGGTGLGLALAEYWIARHHGSLQLESAKGVGTRARVTLPLRREP
jgi:two-component system, NtrC family, nitrogen regulation sensor histidine kinase GlnL